MTAQRTGRTLEILVVDNASTDDTPDVLRRWAARDRRVRAVREARLGLSAAKNAGLTHARGEVVLFTDDDVIVSPGWVEALVAALEATGRDDVVIGGPIVPVPDDLGAWPAWFTDAALRPAGLLDYDDTRELRTFEYLWGANMCARRSVFERVGPWDESVGRRGADRGTFEDTEYQDRARRRGVSVWFCGDAWLRHRVPRSSLSPRRLLRTAVAHGEIDVRIARRTTGPPASTSIAAVAAVPLRLLAWCLCAAAFRGARRAAVFDHALFASRKLGTALELAADEGRASRVRRGIATGARRIVARVEVVIPDGPTAPAHALDERRSPLAELAPPSRGDV